MSDDRPQKLATLLRKLKSAYQPAPPAERSPIDELVYSMLLWESTAAKADRAWKRLNDAAADFNELRVFRPEHIEVVLGERYPLVGERAARLLAVLNALYKSAHAVSLDELSAMPKRDARRRLEGFVGMPPYVACRVSLLALGAHAMPVEERLLRGLIAQGVLEEGVTDVRAPGVLERMVKAADAVDAYLVLQAWSEDGVPVSGKPRRAGKSKPGAGAKRPSAKKKSKTRKSTAR